MIVPIQCHAFGLFFRTRELVGIFSSTTMGSKNIRMWIQIVTRQCLLIFRVILQVSSMITITRCLLTTISDSNPANVIFGKSLSFFWISEFLFSSSHYFLRSIWIYADIYLLQLIKQPITNSKFCNEFFVYLLFEYFYQVKVLNYYHNTPKNANITLYNKR